MVLKVGTPSIMIRSLNSDVGLCNGTKLRVVSLRERSTEATVMSGCSNGNNVFIPRIIFYTEDDDRELHFKLKRKQFPVVPASAMAINKVQGQSIHHVGMLLAITRVCARVTSRKAIKIAVDPEMIDENGRVHTKILYRESFDREVA
ncbi:Helitron helicase [Phytophthora megakarya]|uniref:Helitron helicase n=1 Tax=Phytophthora megakarya TaxID=4795 RepID=A0A225UAT2_9STRA|nr:Helitron helicase [Phytophthora megakarya]